MYFFVIAQGHVLMEKLYYTPVNGDRRWTLSLPWVNTIDIQYLQQTLPGFRIEHHTMSTTFVLDAGERPQKVVENSLYRLIPMTIMDDGEWRPIEQFAEAALDIGGRSRRGGFALEPETWVKHRQAASLLRFVGVLRFSPIIPWLTARETGGRLPWPAGAEPGPKARARPSQPRPGRAKQSEGGARAANEND